jgi:DNA replication protein DnaC
MNTTATLERLSALKLHGMERSLQVLLDTRLLAGLEAPELLAQLVDAEWDERKERRSSRLIRAACFRTATSLAELDFSGDRTLERSTVARYADCSWVGSAEVFIITGPTGIGKSFLAQALGLQACLMGHATHYYNARKLFPTLRRLRTEGKYKRFIDRLANTPVLILDDFGLEVLEPEDRLALFEIIEDRSGKGATIIASQVPVSLWFERIGEPTLADAICDRLTHRAIRFDLKGESRRKITSKDRNPSPQAKEVLEANLPPQ